MSVNDMVIMWVDCPNCDGSGAVPVRVTSYGHDCGGDEELCAQRCPIPIEDYEPEPCEQCGGTGKIPG